jgi:hypothetical protein
MLRSILTQNFGKISQTATRASARPFAFNITRSYHEKVCFVLKSLFI